MLDTIKLPGVGVVVGRFQVSELHRGHVALIQEVLDRHDTVLVLVGESQRKSTSRNPLGYETRRLMILESFPDVVVHPIDDEEYDDDWSDSLDDKIDTHFPGTLAALYGGRDSFIPNYTGIYPAHILENVIDLTGTEMRSEDRVEGAVSYNRLISVGMISASDNRWPQVVPVVDIIVLQNELVLLGRKPTDPEGQYRLPGGFEDVIDTSSEHAAVRELLEETRLMALETALVYVGSFKADDWRFRREADSAMRVSLFACDVRDTIGVPSAGDDLCEVKWVSIHDLMEGDVELVRGHRRYLTTEPSLKTAWELLHVGEFRHA